jgi:tetratricopeptide (TPR) repeat protein
MGPPLLASDLGDAGALLPSACQESFARVAKLIRARRGRFQLVLLDCRDERLRDRLIADLDGFVAAAGRRVGRLDLDHGRHREFADVEAALAKLAIAHDVIHIRGGAGWFDAARWASFNIRREAVAREIKATLLFWLNEEAIAALAKVAIDLWAWRAAVVTFASAPGLPSAPAADFREFDDRLASERERRLAFLREAVLEPDLPGDLRADLHIEMGDLLLGLGRPAPAMRAYEEARRETEDERSRALIMGRIADVLEARGELEEALRIRREEELPVYERLGDVRSRAVTIGQIADVLQDRGELEEALRIRREEELPVYERLGNVRERAVTMGRIADVLQARGELEEALRIRREEQLPVYERLGDVRSRAVTMGKIADVLQARGELEEALRILREEQLPVYERLGDVRSRAVTMGQIADVLLARGELEEALRIRREEQLPVYERLGDVRERAVTLFKIASAEFDVGREHGDDGHQTMAAAAEAFEICRRLGLPDGVGHSGVLFARLLAASGRSGEAETVLDAARAGFAKLSDSDGMQQVDEVRRSLTRTQ